MSGKKTAKPQMGRPPSPGGAKDAVLIVRVSAEEKAAIARAAEREGRGVSEWVRDTLLRGAVREHDDHL